MKRSAKFLIKAIIARIVIVLIAILIVSIICNDINWLIVVGAIIPQVFFYLVVDSVEYHEIKLDELLDKIKNNK